MVPQLLSHNRNMILDELVDMGIEHIFVGEVFIFYSGKNMVTLYSALV